MPDDRLTIIGAVGSPYSRKLRAVLRYRRIAYSWVHQGSPEAVGLPRPRVELLPQLILPGEGGEAAARTDTTPLVRELEQRFASGRSVIPDDPAMAFLDALIEDYGDEWLTKCMFHYRWAFAPDVAKAGKILPRWFRSDQSDASLEAAGEAFSSRQVGRLGVVGSNEVTASVIEDSYTRLLDILEQHLCEHRFIMGGRPGMSDFGIYGQLTQLVGFDPTSAAIALERAGRVSAWGDLVEDLSGLEPTVADWVTRDSATPGLRAILAEAGRVYAPFLLANAAALEAGAEQVECEIDGRPWVQKPFPYQGKCLAWVRRDYDGLAGDDRAVVDKFLQGTGLERLFAGR